MEESDLDLKELVDEVERILSPDCSSPVSAYLCGVVEKRERDGTVCYWAPVLQSFGYERKGTLGETQLDEKSNTYRVLVNGATLEVLRSDYEEEKEETEGENETEFWANDKVQYALMIPIYLPQKIRAVAMLCVGFKEEQEECDKRQLRDLLQEYTYFCALQWSRGVPTAPSTATPTTTSGSAGSVLFPESSISKKGRARMFDRFAADSASSSTALPYFATCPLRQAVHDHLIPRWHRPSCDLLALIGVGSRHLEATMGLRRWITDTCRDNEERWRVIGEAWKSPTMDNKNVVHQTRPYFVYAPSPPSPLKDFFVSMLFGPPSALLPRHRVLIAWLFWDPRAVLIKQERELEVIQKSKADRRVLVWHGMETKETELAYWAKVARAFTHWPCHDKVLLITTPNPQTLWPNQIHALNVVYAGSDDEFEELLARQNEALLEWTSERKQKAEKPKLQ